MSENYLGDDSKVVRITMTRREALERGMVHCVHCGYPPNNHFEFGKRVCAHDKSCPGYKENYSFRRSRSKAPKFIIRMKHEFFYWDRNDPSKNEWVRTKEKATPVTLDEAKTFLQEWKRFKPEALLIL